MSKKFQIMFAGAGGCGKTPVANYLSWRFNLPRMENDALRNEVKEDMLENLENQEVIVEYKRRLKQRYDQLHALGWSFIDDCSIDRTWFTRNEWYHPSRIPFIISFNLSKDFILDRYKAKGYTESDAMVSQLDRWLSEHQRFLDHYSDQVDINIDDVNFRDRIDICSAEVERFIHSLG